MTMAPVGAIQTTSKVLAESRDFVLSEWSNLLEQSMVQRLDRAVGRIAWQQEAKVVMRRAVANHPHRMLFQAREDIVTHAQLFGQLITH